MVDVGMQNDMAISLGRFIALADMLNEAELFALGCWIEQQMPSAEDDAEREFLKAARAFIEARGKE